MAKIQKTNAARLLDRAGIHYELIPYHVDPDDLAATHVAAELGEDIATVFKTLVLTAGPGSLLVCVVPGDAEVDLKKAAAAAGVKKVEMLHMRDLLAATGYIRGGCSPVGMKKALPTFFHITALDHPAIYVSAGVRGLQLKVAPSDIIAYTGASVADIIKPA